MMEYSLAELMEALAKQKSGETILFAKISAHGLGTRGIVGKWQDIKNHPILQQQAITDESQRNVERLDFYGIYGWTENYILVYQSEDDYDWESFAFYPRNPDMN